MACQNCGLPLSGANLNADGNCTNCYGESGSTPLEAPAKGGSAAAWLSFFGTLFGVAGIIWAIVVFVRFGYSGVESNRPMFDASGIMNSLTILISALAWWALAKSIAAGVENTIWIRDKLSENQD